MENLVWVLNPSGTIESFTPAQWSEVAKDMPTVSGETWMVFNTGRPVVIGHLRIANNREALETEPLGIRMPFQDAV